MIYELNNPQQARQVLQLLWPEMKEYFAGGDKMVLQVKKATRSISQNAKFHAMISAIAIAMRGAGSKWTDDDWKRLLIDQWAHDTGRKIGRVAPSLDDERVVQLGWQSHKFTVNDAADFIEWLYSWACEKGIEI